MFRSLFAIYADKSTKWHLNSQPGFIGRVLLAFLCSLIITVASHSQSRSIAISIDDLPVNGPHIPIANLQKMTKQFVDTLRKNNVPAVGFVNESLLYVNGETDERVALLRSWSDGGVELGNHTFSHIGFRDNLLEKYQDDFIRGDAVTRQINKRVRYFRHPFLQMGPTLESEMAFEKFIAGRGYSIAPVTLSPSDWMFSAAYRTAKKRGDKESIKKVADEYLRFAEANLDYGEKASNELFGRQISHILLLHANELTSDNLGRLIAMFKARGYGFVTLETALKDPAYAFPEKYSPTSNWLLLWAVSKGKKFDAPRPPEFIQKAYADEQAKKR